MVKTSQSVSLQDLVKAIIDDKPVLANELVKLPEIRNVINELVEEDENYDFDVAEKFTVLHLACSISAPIFLTILISHGADPNQADSDGKYPVHKACSSGKAALEKVQLFVELSSQNIDRRDELSKQTPLHRAAVKGNVDVVEYLLKCGADINARDKRGETALHKAAFTNRADVLATLLARGVPINEQDDEGHTALHVACSFACLDAIKVLTQNSKCDLHIKNIEDESPYDVALMKDEKPVVEYLKNLVKTRPPRQSRASEPLRTNSERSAANSTRSSANSERSAASSTRSATNSERSTASNKQSANATDSDTEYCENPNGKLLGFSQFVLHAYEKLTSLSDQNIFELKPCFDLPRVADSRSREIQFYATEEAARLANAFGLFVLQESLEPQ